MHLSPIYRQFTRLTIIFSLLCLQACSGPKLEPLAADAEILAFGDSLTYGKGVNSGEDYPAVLAELSGRYVINAGVSGETTAQGLIRLGAQLMEHSPDLLILLEGGNDFLRNTPPDVAKANLAKMIELANSYSIPVLLIAVPEKSIFLSPSDIYEELAETYKLVLLNNELTELLKSPKMKSDTIHLNQAGYRALAEAIHLKLIESGAL